MKKIIFTSTILFFVFSSINAQNIRFGVVGGYNNTTTSHEFEMEKSGFNLGLKSELGLSALAKGCYMDMGLLLTEKGDNNTTEVDVGKTVEFSSKDKENRYYLELPVHFGYKFCIGKDFKLFGDAGPYIAYGLFGKEKITVSGKTEYWTPKIEPGEVDNVFKDNLKRFDWGLGFKIGTEFKSHFQLQAGYDWGLKDPSTSKKTAGKNRNFYISFAYMF